VKRLLVLVALSFWASACNDPVQVDRAESLGPDLGSYEEGPYHRAGQPCTWCHAKGSTASPHFDLAGTVYAHAESGETLSGVRIHLFDKAGRRVTLQSNLAGNFFIAEGDLPLEFPLWVKLEYQGKVTAMQTPIFREPSCAACHLEPASPTSAGRVYLESP
jgi:hypothetical protein